MFKFFLMARQKAKAAHRLVNTPLRFCVQMKIFIVRLGLALKHWSFWLVDEISRSHPK